MSQEVGFIENLLNFEYFQNVKDLSLFFDKFPLLPEYLLCQQSQYPRHGLNLVTQTQFLNVLGSQFPLL